MGPAAQGKLKQRTVDECVRLLPCYVLGELGGTAMVGPRTRSRRIRIHLVLTVGATSSEGTWKAKLARLRQCDSGGPVELRNATRPTGITSTHFRDVVYPLPKFKFPAEISDCAITIATPRRRGYCARRGRGQWRTATTCDEQVGVA
jgi:hypothetical protein